MDRLSSCYFCGDAFDVSLDEYPVVPRDFGPTSETQRTVVLCADCRRKLDAVLETVVEAAEGADASDIESSLEGGEDVLQSVSTDADGTTDSGDGSRTGDDAFEGSGFEDTDADRREVDPDGSSDGSGTLLDATGDADDPRDEPEEAPPGTDEPEEAPPGTDEPDDPDGGSGETTETSLTKLEYNKVMRLLQNREFPVDRGGFVTVAANAYELSHPECEQVIDAAIQHGLIDEADGKLVKPDDGDS